MARWGVLGVRKALLSIQGGRAPYRSHAQRCGHGDPDETEDGAAVPPPVVPKLGLEILHDAAAPFLRTRPKETLVVRLPSSPRDVGKDRPHGAERLDEPRDDPRGGALRADCPRRDPTMRVEGPAPPCGGGPSMRLSGRGMGCGTPRSLGETVEGESRRTTRQTATPIAGVTRSLST